MKTLRISLYSIAIAVIGFFYSGCIDDPVMPQGNYVTGTVHDIYGSKYEIGLFDQFLISPGIAPITIAPENFAINTFGNPFDLVISSYETDNVVKYEDVTSNHVEPVFDDLRFSPFERWSSKDIYIKIPPVSNRCTVFTKFISERPFIQNVYFRQLDKGDTNSYLTIRVPPGTANRDISGRVLYLESNVWTSYQDADYYKFGIKYVDSLYSNYRLEFRESDISYNPPEVLTNFNNIRPPDTYRGGSHVSLSFNSLHKNSDLILLENMDDNMLIPIPILPIQECRIKYNAGYISGGYLEYGFKYIYVEPGQDAEIIHSIPVKLISPSNNDTNINGFTIFSVSDDNTPGVFKYGFMRIDNSGLKFLNIYTTRRTITFSEILTRDFEWRSNCHYQWWVSKLPEYTNTGAVLSTPYQIDERYNNVQLSQSWRFKTGP